MKVVGDVEQRMSMPSLICETYVSEEDISPYPRTLSILYLSLAHTTQGVSNVSQ